MADKPKKQNKAVSPVNGVPTPRGKPFTPETAREARQKRTEKEAAERSITAAFMALMGEIVTTDKKTGEQYTGAQAIARSIIMGAMKGNAEMVKISLALAGETPVAKIAVATGQLADLIDGMKEPCEDDLYTETARADGAVEDK